MQFIEEKSNIQNGIPFHNQEEEEDKKRSGVINILKMTGMNNL